MEVAWFSAEERDNDLISSELAAIIDACFVGCTAHRLPP
jgi:hypothetical protein